MVGARHIVPLQDFCTLLSRVGIAHLAEKRDCEISEINAELSESAPD